MDRQPLSAVDRLILAALAIYLLAIAAAGIWLLIQIARQVTVHPWLLCPAVVVLAVLATGIRISWKPRQP